MVYLFLANGFEEIEAMTPLDVLRRAGVPVTTVGVGGDSILGAHGIRVQADIPDTMYRDSAPDMIILPGGMPGSENLDNSRVVDVALRAGVKNGAYLCAICAAPMVLGKRGYLAGKRAVCYPGFEQYLEGAVVTDARVECDGKIITSKGMGSALEFGLSLVEVLCGKEKAEQIGNAVFAK